MPANTPRGISYPLFTDPVNSLQPSIQDMATDLDTLVQQLVTRLTAPRPAGRMSATANQTLTPFVANTLTYSTEDFDVGSMIDIPTNNTRIRITAQGIYLVGGHIVVTDPAAGDWGLRMDILNSANGDIRRASLKGSNSGGGEPTGTYLNAAMLTYVDGVTPADITIQITTTSGTAGRTVAARSLWATKLSNLPGGY